MQVFWVQTFSTQRLPSPNFFKLSVPGSLRIFQAFASLFRDALYLPLPFDYRLSLLNMYVFLQLVHHLCPPPVWRCLLWRSNSFNGHHQHLFPYPPLFDPPFCVKYICYVYVSSLFILLLFGAFCSASQILLVENISTYFPF